MTKRYSIEQVAQMLQMEAEQVRHSILKLAEMEKLSAESFPFAGQAWRIAPSDVIKIKLNAEAALASSAGVRSETGTTHKAETDQQSQPKSAKRPRLVVRRPVGDATTEVDKW